MKQPKKPHLVDTNILLRYLIGDDPQKAIDLIERELQKIDEVVQTPAPQIGIDDFGDSVDLYGKVLCAMVFGVVVHSLRCAGTQRLFSSHGAKIGSSVKLI